MPTSYFDVLPASAREWKRKASQEVGRRTEEATICCCWEVRDCCCCHFERSKWKNIRAAARWCSTIVAVVCLAILVFALLLITQTVGAETLKGLFGGKMEIFVDEDKVVLEPEVHMAGIWCARY